VKVVGLEAESLHRLPVIGNGLVGVGDDPPKAGSLRAFDRLERLEPEARLLAGRGPETRSLWRAREGEWAPGVLVFSEKPDTMR
jgi:hypothetical protein